VRFIFPNERTHSSTEQFIMMGNTISTTPQRNLNPLASRVDHDGGDTFNIRRRKSKKLASPLTEPRVTGSVAVAGNEASFDSGIQRTGEPRVCAFDVGTLYHALVTSTRTGVSHSSFLLHPSTTMLRTTRVSRRVLIVLFLGVGGPLPHRYPC
jgi:hypothetical protein